MAEKTKECTRWWRETQRLEAQLAELSPVLDGRKALFDKYEDHKSSVWYDQVNTLYDWVKRFHGDDVPLLLSGAGKKYDKEHSINVSKPLLIHPWRRDKVVKVGCPYPASRSVESAIFLTTAP